MNTNLCVCGQYTTTDGETTGCQERTARTFAPGHDAKLKGFLIRAGASGQDVTFTREGLITHHTPEQAASRYAFARMVANGVENARHRARVAAAKAAARADRASAAEFRRALRDAKAKPATPRPVQVTAKVGRWEYVGTVTAGTFTYTDKRGNTLSTTRFTTA